MVMNRMPQVGSANHFDRRKPSPTDSNSRLMPVSGRINQRHATPVTTAEMANGKMKMVRKTDSPLMR